MQRPERGRDLEDGRVGCREPEVDVLHEAAAGRPRVRGDLSAARFEHRRDAQRLEDAAGERRVRLPDVEGVLVYEDAPFVGGRQAFAAGDRDGRRPGQLGVAPGVRVVERLLEEEEVIRLDGLHDGLGDAQVPRLVVVAHVAIEHDVDVPTDMLAKEADLATLEVGGLRGPHRDVALDRTVALHLERTRAHLEAAEAKGLIEVHLGGELLDREVGRAAGRVGRQRFVLAAAQQLVDRDAEHLAAQVPQRGFDAVDHDDAQPHPRPEVGRVVHPRPEIGDPGRLEVLPNQDRLHELDDRRHAFGEEVARIGLADPDELRVRVDLDVGGAASLAALAQVRVVRAGTGEKDGPDVGDLHGSPGEVVGGAAARLRPTSVRTAISIMS